MSANPLQRNLSALQTFNSAAVSVLQKCPKKEGYRFRHTNDGWPVPIDSRGEPLVSVTDPLGVYRKSVRNSAPGGDCLPIFLGSGCGYLFLAACLELGNRMSGALVVEPDIDLFREVLARLDLSKVLGHPGLRIVLGSDLTAIENVVSELLPRLLGARVVLLRDPASRKRHDDYLHQVEQGVNALMERAAAEARFCSECGPQIQENIWRNLPTILSDPPVGRLGGWCAGHPGVLISAGPSLERDLDALSRLEAHPFLVCVDTAYSILQRAGIQPYVVVSCDPNSLNLKHFEATEPANDTILVYVPEVYSEIPQRWTGPRVVLNAGESPTTSWLRSVTGETTEFRKPISVVHGALEVLLNVGCDPIFLLGCDFAYLAEGGESHVLGSALGRKHQSIDKQQGQLSLHSEKAEQAVISEPLVWLPGKEGRDVPTSRTLAMFAKEFERRLREVSVTVIDAGRKGALIEGTRPGDLNEIPVDTAFPRDRLVKEIRSKIESRQSLLNSILGEAKGILAQAAKKAQKGLALCKPSGTPNGFKPAEDVFWELHRDPEVQRVLGMALYPATLDLIQQIHSGNIDRRSSALYAYFEAVSRAQERLRATILSLFK